MAQSKVAWLLRGTATFGGAAKLKNASFSAIGKGIGFRLRVARPVRVELTTYSFGGCRSIHLSYGRTVAFHRKVLESHGREKLRRAQLF
jgi:hypothetical protein